ncbi:MAG: LysR family transcriptional regulator [Acidobacteria bacterium]|nr:MAG: LysR family transcriptional regulator [Acidobacteriota bacterium]REK05937.1 MAG: LysR family transcriptional regulator [Acidobacteriota bacterium]
MGRFNELETFLRIVDAGSITAAADQLEIAKSAVSRRLRDLETRLGVQLLQRTTRTQSLTDAGHDLYRRARQLLDDLDEAEQSVLSQQNEAVGRIRLAAPDTFGHRHLGPALCDFLTLHPRVELDLDLDDRRVDLLAEGFDLAVRIAELEDSSLLARRLATTEHVACASPRYLAEHGEPKTPLDLTGHRCLTYSRSARPGQWTWIDEHGGAHDVAVGSQLRASSGELLTSAAIAGQGIALEPDFIVHEAIETGALQIVLGAVRWRQLDIWAIWPPGRFLPHRVRLLIDFLAERFAGVPYWQRCLARRRGTGPAAR